MSKSISSRLLLKWGIHYLHTSYSINLPLSCCVDKCAMINTDTDRQTVLLLSFQVFLIKAHVMSRDYCDTANELQK